MKLFIKYHLSQAGQKALLKQGGDGRYEQTVSGEITLEQFETLLEPRGWTLSQDAVPRNPATSNNWILLKYSTEFHKPENEIIQSLARLDADLFKPLRYDSPQQFDQLFADYLTIDDAQKIALNRLRTARQAAEKAKAAEKSAEEIERTAKKTAAVERFFSNPDERGKFYELGSYGARDDQVYLPTPGLFGTGMYIEKSHPRFQEIYAEAERRNDADIAAKKAAEAEREAAKRAQVAAWITANGTENQRERLAANLLPLDEAVKAMKEQAFAPAAELPQYDRIKKSDISHEDGCYSGWELECSTDDAETATAEQWELLKLVESMFPDATECSLRLHTCQCDKCQAEETRLGIYVKLQVGNFTFNREFAA